METMTPEVTAAACRYLLIALVQRPERTHPGMLEEIRAGVVADRESIVASANLSRQAEAAVAETLRILDLAGAR